MTMSAACSSGTTTTFASAIKQCPNAGAKCSQSEIETFSQCVQTKCDPEYQTCAGPDYKHGVFAGVCKVYLDCASSCACGDGACAQRCAAPSAECTTCLQNVVPCQKQNCPAPACFATAPPSDAGISSSPDAAAAASD